MAAAQGIGKSSVSNSIIIEGAMRIYPAIKQRLWWVFVFPVIFLAAIVVELVPALKAPDEYFAMYPDKLRQFQILTLGMAGAGTALLALSQFFVRSPRPDEMSTRALGKGVKAQFSVGRTAAGFSVEAPARAVKDALRTGAWLRNPVWRLFSLMGLGALLLVFGLFGFWIAIGPPVIRLIFLVAMVYAGVRTVWMFLRA